MVFGLAACTRSAPPLTTSLAPTRPPATSAPGATATAETAAPASPTAAVTAATPAATDTLPPATPTLTPEDTAVPTPTSFADGLTVRLGTPDPNPNCPNHYPWFFDNPADECADFVHNTWTVLQPFEHGLMVWPQEPGRTIVFLDDGSPFKPYVYVSDPLGLPFPDPDPSIVPPEGLYQPERGFALFWRGLVPGSEWVRQRLGWATAPETAYSAFWQCNTATAEAARCYFNGPRDELIAYTNGGVQHWTYVQTAVR
jgi:hypothetical protein